MKRLRLLWHCCGSDGGDDRSASKQSPTKKKQQNVGLDWILMGTMHPTMHDNKV
jgi:hypothetical protein